MLNGCLVISPCNLAEKDMDNLSLEALQFFKRLDKMRSQGKLRFSSKDNAVKDTYIGEVDDKGNACGEGITLRANGSIKQGTYYKNKEHGYCK